MRDKKKKEENKFQGILLLFLFLAGNVFSSLAGLEFEWSVLPDTSTEGEEMVDILR